MLAPADGRVIAVRDGKALADRESSGRKHCRRTPSLHLRGAVVEMIIAVELDSVPYH
jgi:hypothetical protein